MRRARVRVSRASRVPSALATASRRRRPNRRAARCFPRAHTVVADRPVAAVVSTCRACPASAARVAVPLQTGQFPNRHRLLLNQGTSLTTKNPIILEIQYLPNLAEEDDEDPADEEFFQEQVGYDEF
ncbi:hypothetical protein [Oryza sativa Japonica Group]|uniref:Uncharacterized protein n=1 Tax=Oryza sativa subsp. japonica TaxID=39947 RepID=Q5VP23_ORYSJ|nr:hypothetical protein [Oryza sativa Japonica Group]